MPEPSHRHHTRRLVPFLISASGLPLLILALVVLVALMPLARAIDSHSDRTRPMYEDLTEFEELAADHPIAIRGLGSQVITEDGISVAGEDFTPSPGVTIELRVESDEYCIQASDEEGDESGWDCEPFEFDAQ